MNPLFRGEDFVPDSPYPGPRTPPSVPVPRRAQPVRGLVYLVLLLVSGAVAAEAVPVHHRMTVALDPDRGTLAVRDTLTWPEGASSDRRRILLHAALDPELVGSGSLTRLGRSGDDAEGIAVYELPVAAPQRVTLRYRGRLQQDLEARSSGPRALYDTSGLISAEGVFLGGGAVWYPEVPGRPLTFELTVELPAGWLAVSQGRGRHRSSDAGATSHWAIDQPQDQITLAANRFQRFESTQGDLTAEVYLHSGEPDGAERRSLAQRYLEATHRYTALYERLIGPYPYAKFALVENFWESGYGLPSYTLLGPRVLRLPFIVHTSYPHEILHNWWGNGVTIDAREGNWAEGLTAYLADHLLKAQRGEGAAYRREQLQRFVDYVRAGKDRPLSAFRARHGEASQAIGYGKAAFVFHMLRRDLGDAAFQAGLQRFYADHRWTAADWSDLQAAFEAEAGRSLAGFFEAWRTRTGAPRLGVTIERADKAPRRLTIRLQQTQEAPPFPVQVPVVIIGREAGQRHERVVSLTGRTAEVALEVDFNPAQVRVDPRFDVFRRLAPGEVPPALSGVFGAEQPLAILPAASAESSGTQAAYRRIAQAWGLEAVTADALETLPKGRAVWVFGWDNPWRRVVDAPPLDGDGARGPMRVGVHDLDPAADLIALAGQRTDEDAVEAASAAGWLAGREPRVLAGLARRLPHYGKYSYVVFDQGSGRAESKGRWSSGASALTVILDPEVPFRSLPPRAPLIAAEPAHPSGGTAR